MRRSVDTRAIVMLLFSLAAVLLIMMQWRRSAPKPLSEIARLEGRRMGAIDSIYIHLPFRFMIKMPDQRWRLTPLAHDTTLTRLAADRSMEEQILWLLLSHRLGNGDTLAMAKIGIIRGDGALNASAAALEYLAELIATHERQEERVKIIQQVVTPAHQVLKGAYFAVVLPSSAGRQPVWILAFLPRGDWLHVIRLQTTEAAYPIVKNELQELVQRFFPLPTSVTDPSQARTSRK